MKKELLIICLLLAVSFPAVRSLLLPGGYTSHDLTHHVVRQISMNKLLSEDQFPPRWSGDLAFGYGYPLFLFNYPLPAIIGDVFHRVGLGFVDSVKAVFFLSLILSTVGMYLFLKSLLKSSLAAFLGAVFYLYAPVRFLNVYVSAALGSALALGMLPFVFWAITKGNILLGPIFFAFLILSHNVTALIFAPVLLVFGLFVVNKKKETIITFLLGLGLSAWFFLPAIWEKPLTKFDSIFSHFYQDQFPSLLQLIHSPWGYGLSHPQNPQTGDMSYQLGLIHIGIMLVYSLWFIVYGRKSKYKTFGFFILGGFALSVFLMLKISQPVWDNLPFLNLVQFPWRFLSLSVFMASVGAALLVKFLPYRKILFLALFALVIYANRNHWNINEKFDPGEDYYLSLKTTSTTYGEHLPIWGRIMDKPIASKLEFVDLGGSIKVVKDQSAQVIAIVEATAASKLRFNQYYFPGWNIKVDNKPVSFNFKVEGESYGLPVFDIEKGKHIVLAEFKNTADRNLADGISIVSLLVWVLLTVKAVVLR